MKKQKLELTWIGKDEQPRLEPRILIEDPERSYCALKHQTTPNSSLTKEGSFGKTHSLNRFQPHNAVLANMSYMTLAAKYEVTQ